MSTASTPPAADPRLAAWHLVGTSVDGWNVVERLAQARDPAETGKTGGTFSVGYKVEKNGEEAFLKVFDIIYAFGPGRNFIDELNTIRGSYNHEKALLDLCTTGRMSRIVRIFANGEVPVPLPLAHDPSFTVPLFYIIFERADGGDIRDVFSRFGVISDAVKFGYLHHVAVGIQQLHQASISHQDLKPSNVVIFEKDPGAKIADFGRALKRGVFAEHENFRFAGDPAYAAPEQLYAHQAADWRERREAVDLFQLGSLVAFMFSAKNATAGILDELETNLRPEEWKGSYEDVLPMLQHAFARYLVGVRNTFPDWARPELEQFVKLACDPDVYRRGDPRARAQHGKPLGIDRFISRLNVLRIEAQRRALFEAVNAPAT